VGCGAVAHWKTARISEGTPGYGVGGIIPDAPIQPSFVTRMA